MGEADRLALIHEIEEKRGSRLITYITVDRPGLSAPIVLDDLRVIERHLRLCLAGRAKKIDLFLYTPGGYSIVPWALVSLFREFLGARPFCVLVPARAFSGGTMIAIGADEIVMSPSGNLGPIDIQMNFGEGRIGVESVRAYFKLAQEMGLASQKDKMELFAMLSSSTHPINVGQIYRAWTENERLAMSLLASRKRPLSDKVNKEIADFFLRGVGDHSQSIRRTEARRIGLNFVRDAEDAGVDGPMSDLFDAYEELLSLDVPFVYSDAFREGAGGEMELVDNLGPIALVESLDRLDVAYISERERFWRQPQSQPARTPAPAEPLSAQFEPKESAKLSVRWDVGRPPAARRAR